MFGNNGARDHDDWSGPDDYPSRDPEQLARWQRQWRRAQRRRQVLIIVVCGFTLAFGGAVMVLSFQALAR
jgi:hypothetical protein